MKRSKRNKMQQQGFAEQLNLFSLDMSAVAAQPLPILTEEKEVVIEVESETSVELQVITSIPHVQAENYHYQADHDLIANGAKTK